MDKVKEREVTTLMGDFNAKIGLERIMGKHGLGQMNENNSRNTFKENRREEVKKDLLNRRRTRAAKTKARKTEQA